MKKTLVIFVLFILSIFTNLTIEKSYGRKPAVLPVSGISIDDLEPVTEEQAKGYEFKNELTKSEEVFKRNPSQLDMQVTTETRSEVLPALILFLILLPIGLWISVMKAKKIAPKAASTEVDINQAVAQVVDIKSRQEVAKLKTKENLEDKKETHLPKAS
jgi:hypothetical protein